MKPWMLALTCSVSGCCFFSPTFKDPERPGETIEDVPATLDRYPYGDLSNAKAGEWVTYKEKDGATWTVKVISVQDFIELEITRGSVRQQQKVKPPDKVIESHLLKEKPIPQTIEQTPSRAPVDRQFEEPIVTDGQSEVGGKKISTKVLTRSFADSEGMLHEERYEFSPDVPSLFTRIGDSKIDSRRLGGVVRVATEERVVELIDWGR